MEAQGNGKALLHQVLLRLAGASPAALIGIIVMVLFLRHIDQSETRNHQVLQAVSASLNKVEERLGTLDRVVERLVDAMGRLERKGSQ